MKTFLLAAAALACLSASAALAGEGGMNSRLGNRHALPPGFANGLSDDQPRQPDAGVVIDVGE